MRIRSTNWKAVVLGVAALGLGSGLAGEARGEATIFLSQVGAVDSGVALTNPTVNTAGGSGSLYVWVIPESEQGLLGVSLNLVSSNPGVIELTGATVFNPDIVADGFGGAVTGQRWQTTNSGSIGADLIGAFQGVRVTTGSGLDPALDGSNDLPFSGGNSRDTLRDASTGAFLFAQIDYDVLGLGSTELFLQISQNGISPLSGTSSDVDVLFGAGEGAALNAETQRQISSSLADATITVIPEPAALAMLSMGSLAIIARVRRNRE